MASFHCFTSQNTIWPWDSRHKTWLCPSWFLFCTPTMIVPLYYHLGLDQYLVYSTIWPFNLPSCNLVFFEACMQSHNRLRGGVLQLKPCNPYSFHVYVHRVYTLLITKYFSIVLIGRGTSLTINTWLMFPMFWYLHGYRQWPTSNLFGHSVNTNANNNLVSPFVID
jgi:hypothetical protein